MALIIFRHERGAKSGSVVLPASPMVRPLPVRGARRPIRRVGETQIVAASPAPVIQEAPKLQPTSGIELNLSKRSDSIELDVRPDPAGYWNVEEETSFFWNR